METNFKIAESSDLEILIKFIKEFCDVDNHPFDESSLAIVLTNFLKDKALGQVWLIQQDKEAIGYIVLSFGIQRKQCIC
jgi:diamine N-acetyltransferase